VIEATVIAGPVMTIADTAVIMIEVQQIVLMTTVAVAIKRNNVEVMVEAVGTIGTTIVGLIVAMLMHLATTAAMSRMLPLPVLRTIATIVARVIAVIIGINSFQFYNAAILVQLK